MYLNIEFLVVSYLISLFIDWVFQWNWQSANKNKWVKGNHHMAALAVLTHAFVYASMTTMVLSIMGFISLEKQTMALMVLFISHLVIDTRFPVRWIMRFKGMTWEQINDYQNYGFMHIGIDHRLHEMVLLVLSFLV